MPAGRSLFAGIPSLFVQSGEFWEFISQDFLPPALPKASRIPGVLSSVLVTLALAMSSTIEALEATGAGRLSIFVNAVLPAALSQIVAWAGMRLETNFSECAILGMVGAGGVGFVISNSLQGYDYGTAGVAILLVFLVAYCIERLFVRIKKKFN